MKFLRDNRGVSEVLGAILVFALLISVLSIVQVSGVPALNEQVEFEHNARVQDDMRGFASGVDTAAATGIDQPVDVETGVRYPPRLFLLNPGPTAGTLSTTGPSDVTFGNLEALDPEAGEYLNSSNTPAPAPYTTTGLVYQPNYNQYTVAPETRYEHGIIYNVDDEGGVSVIDGGSIVSGKRISLTVLDGTLATSGGDSVSFTAVPVSGPSQVVSVRGANGVPMTLTLPTALSNTTWNELLDEEITNGHVDSAVVSGGEVTITFEAGITYDLRLAKVAVSSGVDDEQPAYLTKVGPASPAIQPGGTDLTVELRDRYNTPVAGEEVRFRITEGIATFQNGATGTTGTDGRVTVTVNPGDSTSLTVDAQYDADGTDRDEFIVVYDSLVVADNAQSTGDLKDINPNDGTIIFTNTTVINQSTVEIDFLNTGSDTWTFTRTRVSFVLGTTSPDEVDITEDGDIVVENLSVGSPLTDITDVSFTGNEGKTLTLSFDKKVAQSGGNGQPFDGLVVITFEAKSEAGETKYLTYFAA
jgi:hypothetical protein